MTELTAHRTLALREAVANDPHTAFLGMLHALCLKLFYGHGLDTCLEVEAKNVLFGAQVQGLGDMAYAKAIDTRHGTWAAQLPKEPAALWDMLCDLDGDSRQALFAHCVGLSINATFQPYDRRPKALAHAGRLAETVQFDMAAAGWRPTVASYLGRVTKAQILDAVREGKGDGAAQLIEDLKKAEMAREAERLLKARAGCPSRCGCRTSRSRSRTVHEAPTRSRRSSAMTWVPSRTPSPRNSATSGAPPSPRTASKQHPPRLSYRLPPRRAGGLPFAGRSTGVGNVCGACR